MEVRESRLEDIRDVYKLMCELKVAHEFYLRNGFEKTSFKFKMEF